MFTNFFPPVSKFWLTLHIKNFVTRKPVGAYFQFWHSRCHNMQMTGKKYRPVLLEDIGNNGTYVKNSFEIIELKNKK